MYVCVCVKIYIYIYIHTPHLLSLSVLFIYLSVHGYLGRYHILAIVNNAAVNIGVHIYF